MENGQGRRLEYIRETKGYTQTEIADVLDIKRQTYANYECGNIAPPLKSLIKLADFYQLPFSTLLYQDEDLPEKIPLYKNDIADVVRSFDSLNNNGQKTIINFSKYLFSQQTERK